MDLPSQRADCKPFMDVLRYFGCKLPAIFFDASTCQDHRISLASRLKAGLPGWWWRVTDIWTNAEWTGARLEL